MEDAYFSKNIQLMKIYVDKIKTPYTNLTSLISGVVLPDFIDFFYVEGLELLLNNPCIKVSGRTYKNLLNKSIEKKCSSVTELLLGKKYLQMSMEDATEALIREHTNKNFIVVDYLMKNTNGFISEKIISYVIKNKGYIRWFYEHFWGWRQVNIIIELTVYLASLNNFEYIKFILQYMKVSKNVYDALLMERFMFRPETIEIILALSPCQKYDLELTEPEDQAIIEFNKNPREKIKELRWKYKITSIAAEIFALVIFECDGLLKKIE